MNILAENKIHKSKIGLVKESLKLGKQLVAQGKLSQEDLENIAKADPTPTKKYTGWMSKIFIKDKPSIDNLRNTIEEFNVFLEKGKSETKDINSFKSFDDLKKEVDKLNALGTGLSVKDLEEDYDVVVDNEDLYIASPHTHEASRKLGLSQFAYRDCSDGDGGKKDSAWCTTYKAPDHFNSYYYQHDVTFYYVKVKSERLMNELKKAFPNRWKELTVTALAVLANGQIDGYDGLDNQMSSQDVSKYTDIIGIS